MDTKEKKGQKRKKKKRRTSPDRETPHAPNTSSASKIEGVLQNSREIRRLRKPGFGNGKLRVFCKLPPHPAKNNPSPSPPRTVWECIGVNSTAERFAGARLGDGGVGNHL